MMTKAEMRRILMQGGIAVVVDQFQQLKAENAALRAELERERMRLAACGAAALGYFEDCLDEYKSASLDDVLRLQVELAALKAANWQPIETAPKDGTSIIVCSDTGGVWCNVKWEKRPRAGERWEHFTIGALRFAPILWMPIPKAPNAAMCGGRSEDQQSDGA